MLLVDTNILLYAINEDSPHHKPARAALETLAAGSYPWALSLGVVYEFLRVATHSRVFARPLTLSQALDFVDGLIRSESCVLLMETEYHLQELRKAMGEIHRVGGNMVHDLHQAVLMREHAVKDILTLDEDFKAFPWVEVRDLDRTASAGEAE